MKMVGDEMFSASDFISAHPCLLEAPVFL